MSISVENDNECVSPTNGIERSGTPSPLLLV